MVACIPVDINHNQVCVEVAKTLLQQSKGLAGRKSIKNDYAMLFDMRSLGAASRAFWTMQGMKFPLDMVFIKDNKIITIMYDVKPCNYDDINKCQVFGGFPMDYVIETKSGNANKWGLHISQQINFSFPAAQKDESK